MHYSGTVCSLAQKGQKWQRRKQGSAVPDYQDVKNLMLLGEYIQYIRVSLNAFAYESYCITSEAQSHLKT